VIASRLPCPRPDSRHNQQLAPAQRQVAARSKRCERLVDAPRRRRVSWPPQVFATRLTKPIAQHCSVRDRSPTTLKPGKAKKRALGALMRRLLHIALGILKSGKPYDPQLVPVRACA
jgi:hypothetical protein